MYIQTLFVYDMLSVESFSYFKQMFHETTQKGGKKHFKHSPD